MRLQIKLLGPFQVLLAGQPARFATDRARALLAYLAVEANRPHRRTALAGLLWPDRPENLAQQNFNQSLSRLRRAIGDRGADPPFLQITSKTVQFNAGTADMDVAQFEVLLKECSAHPHPSLNGCLACISRLEFAASLYRGEFLHGLFLSDSQPFEEWALIKREQLHRQALNVLHTLAAYSLEQGAYEQAQRTAERQLGLEPWNEEAHRQLMQAMALNGQRSLALALYRTCCRLLADELGVEPAPATTDLYERIRLGQQLQVEQPVIIPPQLHQAVSPEQRHNLPAQTTFFVGREVEQAGLARLLADPQVRLVTIHGPGGIGKTRLAIEVAKAQLDAFQDGVWYVPLAPVDAAIFSGSINPLIAALAGVLEIAFHGAVPPLNQLLAFLQEKEILLLFDNCEHLLASTGLLSDLLLSLPGLKVLATSRERLNLQEEWIYPLEGLGIPPDGTRLEELTHYGAVELFWQLARQVQPHFNFRAESGHIVRICRLVSGMPLSIQLAASWARSLPCHSIALQIEARIDFLATSVRNLPERHRSLRAVFDHSWRLLSDDEQAVMKKLSVFQGSFQLEAAKAVAGASLGSLSALVDKSLLSIDPAGRYQIHELLRQYATEKLLETPGDDEQTPDLHCLIFLDFLRRQEGDLKGPGLKAAMEAITAEIDNLRAAWRRAIERERLVEIKQAMFSFWQFYEVKGWYLEADDRLSRAIERFRPYCLPAPILEEALLPSEHCLILGSALAYKAWFKTRLGDYEQARALFDEVFSILRRAASPARQETGLALIFYGVGLCIWGDPEKALEPLAESMEIFSLVDEPWGKGTAMSMLGQAYMFLGQPAQAEPLLQESIAIFSGMGNLTNITYAMSALGHIAQVQGRFLQAEAIYKQCLQIRRDTGDRTGMAFTLCDLGEIARLQGAYRQAEQYYLQSVEISKEIGFRAQHAEALRGLGNLVERQGDYAAAKKYFQDSLVIHSLSGLYPHSPSALTGIGWAALGLQEQATAKGHFMEAIQFEARTQRQPILLDAIAGMAHYHAWAGHPERALELLALVIHHPASMQETKNRAIQLKAGLTARLGPGAAAAALARGKGCVLTEVVEEILSVDQ